MIVLDCAQGTPQWHAARAGVVTASGFDKILTAGGKPSAQAHAYLCRIVEEAIYGPQNDEEEDNAFMERGRALEPEARAWYELDRDVDVRQVGMILRDDRRVGCSPDGLVGDRGGVEFKCPLRRTHIGYLVDPSTLEAKYRNQVQVCLLVSARDWWDLVSYCPGMPGVAVRSTPDAAWRKAAEPALESFLSRVDEAVARLTAANQARVDANPFL